MLGSGPEVTSHTMSTRPRTPAQQEASRQNGAKSRGPVTEAGKERSRLNATRHGLCAQAVLLPDEDELACEALVQDYEYHYQPVTALELARVREMALCDWRLRRVVDIERGLLSLALHDAAKAQQRCYTDEGVELDEAEALAFAFRRDVADTSALTLLLRYQAQLQRTQERARKAFLQLQAERLQQQAERAAYEREHAPVLGTRLQVLRHAPNEPEPTLEPPLTPANKTPNEPEPTSVAAAEQPNEPKLTRQQRRWAERNRRKG